MLTHSLALPTSLIYLYNRLTVRLTSFRARFTLIPKVHRPFSVSSSHRLQRILLATARTIQIEIDSDVPIVQIQATSLQTVIAIMDWATP